MNEEQDEIKRWTARRKVAVIMDIIKGKTTATEVARGHDLTVGEAEQWMDDFVSMGTESLRSHPRDTAPHRRGNGSQDQAHTPPRTRLWGARHLEPTALRAWHLGQPQEDPLDHAPQGSDTAEVQGKPQAPREGIELHTLYIDLNQYFSRKAPDSWLASNTPAFIPPTGNTDSSTAAFTTQNSF